jgi:hypothetical protein
MKNPKKEKKKLPTFLGNRRLIAASPLARHPYLACESSLSEGEVTPSAAASLAAVEKSECLESNDSMKRTVARSRSASAPAAATESLALASRRGRESFPSGSSECSGCT